MIERAYQLGESPGLQVWCEDEAGPYQTTPQPGTAWRPAGEPRRQDHQYIRGKTAKLLTLVRPATGELRAKAVEQCPNAVLHPWLKQELTALLKGCASAPTPVPEGCRWQDWDISPAAEQLDRFFPPIRVLLVLDNLAGHHSREFTRWCAEQGVCLLYTPTAGSWLNMAESVQRILSRRAVEGQHIYDVEILRGWLEAASGGMEPRSNTVHLGRQTPCSSRPRLRAQAPSRWLRGYHTLRASSTPSLGTVLSQDRLLATGLGK